MNKKTDSQCDRFEQMLFELDEGDFGELTELQRAEIEQHLAKCSSCRNLRDEESKLTQLLMSVPSTRIASNTPKQPNPTFQPTANHWNWPAIAAVAIVLLLATVAAFNLGKQHGQPVVFNPSELPANADDNTAFGSINTRPVITNASYITSTIEALKTTNHIELPAGATATIVLKDTGQVIVTGPAVLEIDRIDNSWKVTLLSGQARIDVLAERTIKVAGKLGSAELKHGTHLVSNARPFVQTVEQQSDKDNMKESVTENDDEKNVTELVDQAMSVFSASADSGPEAMRRSAALLQKVVHHPEANLTQKLSASFYLPAALANSAQYEEALMAARSFRDAEQNAGFPDESILAIIGDCLWKLGNHQEAKKSWTELLEKYPNSLYEPLIKSKLLDGGKDGKPPEPDTPSDAEPKTQTDPDSKLGVLWTKELKSPSFGGAAVADVDDDGRLEVAFGAIDDSKKWEAEPGDSYFMSPTSLADLNGDGDLEVIAASENVTVINHDGKIIWSEPCALRNSRDSATRGPSIADLNGDGQLDIATLVGSGEFQVRSGDDGRSLYQFAAR